MDLVQRHDATQLRGGQWTVSTPALREEASIRAVFSYRIELSNQKNICLNCNKNVGMFLNITFAFKKNYPMRSTTFAEVITQCSSNQERSTMLPVSGNKIRQI